MFNRLFMVISILAMALATGCGGGSSAPEAPSAPPAATGGDAKAPEKKAEAAPKKSGGQAYSTALATASVSGVVTLAGDAPKQKQIDMSTNPDCATLHKDPVTREEVVAKDGKLANVVVYVKSGFDKWTYEAPSAAVSIDQQGCQYHPHVLAMMAGQPLDVLNSDPLAHNIHAKPVENSEWNLSQGQKGMKTTKKFETPEMAIRIGCDVHKWMGAFAFVFEHPFFAVTDADGKFEIKLPPGEYELATWHETSAAGAKAKLDAPAAVKVTVEAGKPATQNFEYKVGQKKE